MINIVRYDYQVPPYLDWVKNKKIVAVDTETTGLVFHTSKVHLLQIGDAHTQWVFDCAKLGDREITKVLESIRKKIKVAHNVKFDYGMLRANYGVDLPNWRCTYLGNELLIKGIKTAHSNLESCISKYLGETVDKSVQKGFSEKPYGTEFTDQELEYAAADVKFLIPLYNKINKLIFERDMETVYALENETVRAVAELELNGIYLNPDKWIALAKRADEEKDRIRTEMDKMVVDAGAVANLFGFPDINYDSPLQIKKKIEEFLGFVIKDTNSNTLQAYKKKSKFVELLLEYRHYSKRASTYGYKFLEKHVDPKTGRIHASYHQLGTETGRMSSSNPNGQNIPNAKEYRACFQPQNPDYLMISADFSSQELRLLAQISGDERLVWANKNNLDVHSYSASLIYGLPYEDFLTYDENGKVLTDKAGDPIIKDEYKVKYRKPAKTIGFGLWKKLAEEKAFKFGEPSASNVGGNPELSLGVKSFESVETRRSLCIA